MSAWDYMGDPFEHEEDEGYFTHPKPSTYRTRERTKMHRYKILVVISGTSGLTSQLLHYVDYDDAEEAYTELTKGSHPSELNVNYIRLYKQRESGWRRRG